MKPENLKKAIEGCRERSAKRHTRARRKVGRKIWRRKSTQARFWRQTKWAEDGKFLPLS